MAIICYMENGMQLFTKDDVIQWKHTHPNATIVYVFNEKADMLRDKQHIETSFAAFCGNYQLHPDLLHKQFYNSKGHTIELTGYRPENKKYKFIIYDIDEQKTYKVTPRYIKELRALT